MQRILINILDWINDEATISEGIITDYHSF